jgi:hypothetical protein
MYVLCNVEVLDLDLAETALLLHTLDLPPPLQNALNLFRCGFPRIVRLLFTPQHSVILGVCGTRME